MDVLAEIVDILSADYENVSTQIPENHDGTELLVVRRESGATTPYWDEPRITLHAYGPSDLQAFNLLKGAAAILQRLPEEHNGFMRSENTSFRQADYDGLHHWLAVFEMICDN